MSKSKAEAVQEAAQVVAQAAGQAAGQAAAQAAAQVVAQAAAQAAAQAVQAAAQIVAQAAAQAAVQAVQTAVQAAVQAVVQEAVRVAVRDAEDLVRRKAAVPEAVVQEAAEPRSARKLPLPKSALIALQGIQELNELRAEREAAIFAEDDFRDFVKAQRRKDEEGY